MQVLLQQSHLVNMVICGFAQV